MKVSDEARKAAASVCATAEMCIAVLAGRMDDSDHVQAFARFEAEVRKDERERCAKVADIWGSPQADELARSEGASSRDRKTARIVAAGIAAAIRSLSDDGEGG